MFNTLRPRQNRRHFADDVFKCNFLNENVWIPIKISLKFVPKGPINNIPALVQIMACRRSGDKPLSEPMMVSLPTHTATCTLCRNRGCCKLGYPHETHLRLKSRKIFFFPNLYLHNRFDHFTRTWQCSISAAQLHAKILKIPNHWTINIHIKDEQNFWRIEMNIYGISYSATKS